MRSLRVVGLADDGAVICETETTSAAEKPERFSLKVDDKLRAAARGDLARIGQIEIEVESPMRPREIQARIRAGASVEQVAEMSGLPVEKVDRFAYPVLLERSRTAELAQRAHPIRDDGPDVRTLGEVVANTFGQRGQDYTAVSWDSWKGEDGKWVIQLHWTAGRSDNRAHWTFHPGAHGGTVTVLDEHAADLIDPSAKPLRTVRPVTALAEQALQLEASLSPPRQAEPALRYAEPAPREAEPAARYAEAPPRQAEPAARYVEAPPRQAEPAPRYAEPAPRQAEPAARHAEPAPRRTEPAARRAEPTPRRTEPAPHHAEPAAPRAEPHQRRAAPAARSEPAQRRAEPAARRTEPAPRRGQPTRRPAVAPPQFDEPPAAEAQAQTLPEPEEAPAEATGTTEAAPTRRGRNNRPTVPSWEDVLLGVRSNRG
jgi:hypothetical protein